MQFSLHQNALQEEMSHLRLAAALYKLARKISPSQYCLKYVTKQMQAYILYRGQNSNQYCLQAILEKISYRQTDS